MPLTAVASLQRVFTEPTDRHVQSRTHTHTYIHSYIVASVPVFAFFPFFFFYFSRVNFYLNAKQVIGAPVSSRSSSLVWALLLIRVLLCLT